jgi:hypothetical protein
MLEAKSAVNSGASDLDCIIPARPQRKAKKPFCIVLHQERSKPGHVDHWFRRNGYALDVRKPRYPDPFPAHTTAGRHFWRPHERQPKLVRSRPEPAGTHLE